MPMQHRALLGRQAVRRPRRRRCRGQPGRQRRDHGSRAAGASANAHAHVEREVECSPPTELSPTHTSNSPARPRTGPGRCRSRSSGGPSVNVTVVLCPGASVTRWNPSSLRTGCRMLVTFSCMYSWATSAPAGEPVLVNVPLTVTRPVGRHAGGRQAQVRQRERRVGQPVPERVLRRVVHVEVLRRVLVVRVGGPARRAARCTRSGSARRCAGTTSAACRSGLTFPNRTSATASPPSVPGYQASSSAGALSASQGMVSGRPFISTTTYGLPVAAIGWTSASCWPGRSMSLRDDASPLSRRRLADDDDRHVGGLRRARPPRRTRCFGAGR